jgi:hypothetical protein
VTHYYPRSVGQTWGSGMRDVEQQPSGYSAAIRFLRPAPSRRVPAGELPHA